MDTLELSFTVVVEKPQGQILAMDKVKDVISVAFACASLRALSFEGHSKHGINIPSEIVRLSDTSLMSNVVENK